MRPPSGWPLFWETATCVNEVNVSQGQVNCDRWSHLVHECIGTPHFTEDIMRKQVLGTLVDNAISQPMALE